VLVKLDKGNSKSQLRILLAIPSYYNDKIMSILY